MKIKLTVTKGKATRDHVSLRLPAVIGRSKETDLTVVHPMVSRRHCELVEIDGLVLIRDLGSLNGTLLDGEKIKEGPLPPNAQFSVGPLSFSIEYEFAGDLSALPPVVPAFTEEIPEVEDSTPIEEPVLELEEEEKSPDGETDSIGATADTDSDIAFPAEAIEEDEQEEEDDEALFGFPEAVEDEAEPDEPVEAEPLVEAALSEEPLEEPEEAAVWEDPSEKGEGEDEDEEPIFGFLEEVDDEAEPDEPVETEPLAEAALSEEPLEEPEEAAPIQPPSEEKDEEEFYGFLEEDEAKVEESPAAKPAVAKPEKSHEVDDDDILDFLSDDDSETKDSKPKDEDDALDEFFKSLD